jgi:hypothetical protein
MTPVELFIYHSVNSKKDEPTIKFSQISQSIKDVWIEIWNRKSIKKQIKIILSYEKKTIK